MKWPKSEEFSEIHGVFTLKICTFGAPQALLAKMGCPSSRLSTTDGDGVSAFENQAVASSPLIEISLMAPFPPTKARGVSECRVPATFWGPTTLARTKVDTAVMPVDFMTKWLKSSKMEEQLAYLINSRHAVWPA